MIRLSLLCLLFVVASANADLESDIDKLEKRLADGERLEPQAVLDGLRELLGLRQKLGNDDAEIDKLQKIIEIANVEEAKCFQGPEFMSSYLSVDDIAGRLHSSNLLNYKIQFQARQLTLCNKIFYKRVNDFNSSSNSDEKKNIKLLNAKLLDQSDLITVDSYQRFLTNAVTKFMQELSKGMELDEAAYSQRFKELLGNYCEKIMEVLKPAAKFYKPMLMKEQEPEEIPFKILKHITYYVNCDNIRSIEDTLIRDSAADYKPIPKSRFLSKLL